MPEPVAGAPPDVVVERLLRRVGIPLAAPVDLGRVAAALGVSDLRTADLVEDGRLERSGGRVEILVRRRAAPARRRFTIAHELAHLLVEGSTPGPAAGERRCDAIAASLLLPRAWVASAYAERPRCLATVRALAREAGVSLSAAVVRLDEVLGWRRALLRFGREAGAWRFLAACAAPPALSIRSAPSTSAALDEIARRGTRDLEAAVPLRVSDRLVEVRAEVSVRSGSALALAQAGALSLGPAPPTPRV